MDNKFCNSSETSSCPVNTPLYHVLVLLAEHGVHADAVSRATHAAYQHAHAPVAMGRQRQ